MITKLQIKDFKCFSNPATFSFSRVNVFSGINGVGKSTIIQSLLLLAQSVKEGEFTFLNLAGRYVKLGTFSDVRNAYSEGDTFSINISTKNGYGHEMMSSYRQPENSESQWAEIISLVEDGHDFFEEKAEVGEETGGGKMKRSLGSTTALSSLNEFRYLFYIPADRIGPHDEEVVEREMDKSDIGIRGEHVINVLRLQGEDFLKQVEKALCFILQDASIRTEDDGVKARLFIGAGNDTKSFKPSNVGFAYGYILPIVMAALLLPENGLLFIENPEAHLHEGAQSRLMKFLCQESARKNMQLFIETHSEHIVRSLQVEVYQKSVSSEDIKVYHFVRKDDQHEVYVINLPMAAEGQIEKTPDGFFNQAEKDLDILTGI